MKKKTGETILIIQISSWFIFLQLIGVVVLGFSVFALTDGEDVAKLVQRGSGSDLTVSIYGTASTVLIVVSVMVIIIAFLGCCGAMKVHAQQKLTSIHLTSKFIAITLARLY